ncbi:MAG: SpoIID/LytB domain-containing protein [Cyanobacteria bacterium P01_H01_bin.58]
MTFQFHQEWQRVQSFCKHTQPVLRSRLAYTTGALLASVLVLRFVPLGLGSSESVLPVQEGLWRTTGMVRQSVVDLYRIQRAQQTATATEMPSDATDGTETTAEATSQPNTAPQPTAQPANSTPPANASIAVANNPNVIDNALEMRVAIARNVPSLTVGTNTPGWALNTDGSAHCDIPAQGSVVAYPTAQGINFGGCPLTGAIWIEADNGGFVYIGKSWYRGRILLFNNGGQLLAVNFVLLGDYLASVVGSEMYHHWPLEAFKAQAVAARSYALTHHVRPASDYFDLDNTQRFQAYKGISWETANTQRAVMETAGEFISYDGGIVESLYAASDQIVQEAHGGQGMSQTGAKDYALQGYGYDQILGAYYPGTSLARLVVE